MLRLNLANVRACPLRKLFAFRRFSEGERVCEPDRFRVTVVGAAGGIGQPLSLLLRLHPLVSSLKLYDLKLAKGICADLSHIDRPGTTKGFEGKEELLKALRGTDIAVLAAGVPRQPGQTRDDLFEANASIVAEVADAVGIASPEAFLAIITNPVNSTVPIAAEVLKKRNVYNPALLAGITTLDVVRTRKFIADCIFVDPRKLKLPVIGGHSGKTIIPLISQAEPSFTGDAADIERITQRVQNAGTEVVEAKAGAGSATLSMAYAAANFVNALLIAKSEKKEVRDVAYVESCLTPVKYFASEVIFGPVGIVDTVPLPELSAYEDSLLCEALPVLLEDIKKGTDFGLAYTSVACQKDGDNAGDKPAKQTPTRSICGDKQQPTSRDSCSKKEDKADKAKDSCEEVVRQMKNAPCRKSIFAPKKEEHQNSKHGAGDSKNENKCGAYANKSTTAPKNEENQNSKHAATDSKNDKCGGKAYNPCDDLLADNDKTPKK